MELPASLTRAAKENNIAEMATLTSEGHAINIRDPRGHTPLMLVNCPIRMLMQILAIYVTASFYEGNYKMGSRRTQKRTFLN